MTLVLAFVILLTIPVFITLLRGHEHRRLWAFSAIAASPFCSGLPVLGYLYGWPTWSGTTLGIAVALADVLAIALISTRRRVSLKTPFWVLFAFYGFTLFLSIFTSSLWIGTIFTWWQFARMLLLFSAITGEAHRTNVQKHIVIGFAIGFAYQAGNVILQKIAGDVQASGTFASQNILGLAIELALPVVVGYMIAGYRHPLLNLGVIAALICIAGSGSRATTALCAMAIFLLLTLSMIRRLTPQKIRIATFALAGLAVASPFAIATLNSRFEGGTFFTEEITRTALETTAKTMASEYPIGVGANQFVIVANQGGYNERAGLSWRMEDRSKPVHNAYLLARAETGWLGEITFIAMLAVPMLFAFRLAFGNRKSRSGEVALGCGVGLMINMLHNHYEYAVHTGVVLSLVFINFGIIAALWRVEKGRKRKPLRRPSTRREAMADDGRVPEPVALRST